MKWYNSLVFKIIACCVVLILCLLGSIFGVLYRYEHSILSEMDEKSSEILRAIQLELTNLKADSVSRDDLQRQLADLQTPSGVRALTLYDTDRNVVTNLLSNDEPIPEFEDPPEESYFTNVPGPGGRTTTRYVQTFALALGDNELGYVRLMLDISPQTHLVKALQSRIVVSLVFIFLGTLGLLCYFIFKLLSPLHAMAVSCQKIGEGNLQEIQIQPNASEVLVLEMKFNEMVHALQSKAEMEEKLVQAQRLSALGNLAAGIAHEIGNPLNGIKLTISHIKDVFSRDTLDKGSFERYTETILGEVNRLDRIVRDFLTLAKERELSLHPHRLDKLLRETVHLIEKDAQKRGIRLETDIPTTTREVLMDAPVLKGALLNILINAMQASERDGSVHVSLAESDGCLVAQVEDQGEGMSQDVLDRVFEPYFSTKQSGTGLGLSLTKNIIEKHSGKIEIESRKGEGTTVTLTIPAGSA